MPIPVSAADLRAEIARKQLPIYRLASLVGLHPSHLGQIIGGRRPLSEELALRITLALADETDRLHAAIRDDEPVDAPDE